MDPIVKAILFSIWFFIAGLVLAFLYAWANSLRLGFYLRKNNYARWRELTTIGKFGPGASNPFKGFPYLYGELDNDDESILRHKDRIKIGLRYSFFLLIALIVNIGILAVHVL